MRTRRKTIGYCSGRPSRDFPPTAENKNYGEKKNRKQSLRPRGRSHGKQKANGRRVNTLASVISRLH